MSDAAWDVDEHLRRVDDVRRFARERLASLATSGEPGRVNRPLLRALGESLLPRVLPEEPAARVGALELCAIREGLATECTEAETALALQGLGGHPILCSATEALRRTWIPKLARGQAVAAFALSEPESGSDPGSLTTSARRTADGWLISGTKTWISNAPEADVYTVFARTSPEGARGVTAFVVPGGSGGLSGEAIDMIAPHAIGRLDLDDVRVGDDSVLGGVGEGFKVAMRTLDLFRPSVGAFAVGMCQAALEASVAHAGRRMQGGALLREHQAVAHQLAEMATLTEAARALVHRAASRHDADRGRNTRLAAMAKLFATESAQRVVDMAVQVHGASGLVKGHAIEHLYREVRAPRIYEGTSEIQRTVIARELYR